MTLKPFIFDTEEINSSVIPSAKYSSAWSGLMFAKGRTAILSFGIKDMVELMLAPYPATWNTSIGVDTFLSTGLPNDWKTYSVLLGTLAYTCAVTQMPPG